MVGLVRKRGGFASLVATLIGVGLALPAAASAGTVSAAVTVQGAGVITSNGVAGLVCDRNSNVDDRVTVPCGGTSLSFPDFATPVLVVIATPRPNPGAHTFLRWEGCPSPSANTCTMIGPPIGGIGFALKAVFADDVAPTVTVGSATYSTTADRTVSFPLGASGEAVPIQCSIDSGPFSTCTSSTPFTVAEGAHNVRARATDPSGNVSTPTAPVSFRVLDTRLVSGPPDFHSSKTATFKFSTLTGLTFDCALDSTALADCGTKGADNTLTKTFANLAEGPHTFRVAARDGADFDRVPIVRTWTVDTVPPETSLDPAVGPRDGEVTTLFTAAFSIGANEPASLECRLLPADFAPCGPQVSFADLPFAQSSFQARAVDRAGNVDATPASRTWTVLAVDLDGDGFNQRTDCNDQDPSISPGRTEIRGNDVDENCDSVAAPLTRPNVSLSHTFRAFARYTTLTKLLVKGVPRGATVKATCAVEGKKSKKKKCPKKARKAFSKRNASGTVSLNSRYKGVKLPVGTTITVTVTQTQTIGAVKILTIRKGKAPQVTDRCLPPGARRAQRC